MAVCFLEAPGSLSEAHRADHFITRLRLDAALYEGAPPRYPGRMGRPRLKGKRLPNLSIVAEDPDVGWESITITGWYGSGERTVEVVSETAVWHRGYPPCLCDGC